jgi:hypothetical protein
MKMDLKIISIYTISMETITTTPTDGRKTKYKPTPTQRNEYQRRWVAKCPEKVKEYHKAYDSVRYELKREQILAQKKEYYLRKKQERQATEINLN